MYKKGAKQCIIPKKEAAPKIDCVLYLKYIPIGVTNKQNKNSNYISY